jgi:hypothetical protein
MRGTYPTKTAPFAATPDNRDHVFTVEHDGEHFICVVPEPMAAMFGGAYQDEASAWMEIVRIRTVYPSAMQWPVQNKEQCYSCLLADFKTVSVSAGDIDTGWFIFKEGSSVKDIKRWFKAEFGL